MRGSRCAQLRLRRQNKTAFNIKTDHRVSSAFVANSSWPAANALVARGFLCFDDMRVANNHVAQGYDAQQRAVVVHDEPTG